MPRSRSSNPPARQVIADALSRVASVRLPPVDELQKPVVNPSLEILTQPGGLIMVWRHPAGGPPREEIAVDSDLLALKLVLEGRSAVDAAAEAGVTVGRIESILWQAADKGLILMPRSRLRRTAAFHTPPGGDDRLLETQVFSLQWHITQECDLNCRHCYDRSRRRSFTRSDGIRLLDDLRSFCSERFVRGQVSFTGGNPFLHPDFQDFYTAASERGFATAILGNPVGSKELEQIIAIQQPVYFQVSLEGLEQHNDAIRGHGHFRRTLDFLDLLRECAVPTQVMLTLTRENLPQVLPLGELLRGRTDIFSFNRLALFGEGASLSLPDKDAYAAFLHDYLAAMAQNPVLGMKDNLLNLALYEQGQPLFDGCAGFGCGAAFNFLAVLSDGEVHACRKFPSLLGSFHASSLAELYDSPAAAAYRERSATCSACPLAAVCGGCPAITASLGRNPAIDRDPFCCKQIQHS